MTDLGFRPFDADNHYYEAIDAFTRHMPKEMSRRGMQWVEMKGRQRLLVGGKLNSFIPNPTFDPVSKPGALDAYFRGRTGGSEDLGQMFGELEPIPAAYRDRDARIEMMDAQGLEGAWFFPTLGVGMEESLRNDVPAMLAAFSAFNRWIDDDWGFAYQNRIFGAPYLTLSDPSWAEQELAWAIERGVKVVVMRAAPPPVAGGGTRSPGDAACDRFWSMCEDAGVVVAYHSGDAGYGRFLAEWEPRGDFRAFEFSPMMTLTSGRPSFDLFGVLTTHGVFDRHPKLKTASIEAGSDWLPELVKKLKKVYGQRPQMFAKDPVEQLVDHLWIAPFYEDDIRGLVDIMGADHVLFGSDFPHAEGLADPATFVDDLPGFTDAEIKAIMRDNALTAMST